MVRRQSRPIVAISTDRLTSFALVFPIDRLVLELEVDAPALFGDERDELRNQ